MAAAPTGIVQPSSTVGPLPAGTDAPVGTAPIAVTGAGANSPWRINRSFGEDQVELQKLQRQSETMLNAGANPFKSVKDEISRLEARIQTYFSTGGGLVKDQYGDEKPVIELKQAQEELHENLQEESRKTFNAKLVWQQNITEAKVELSRNQYTLRQVEERIRRRDAAKLSASTTSGRGAAGEAPVNTSPSYRAAIIEAHAVLGKATDDTLVAVFADLLRKLINTSSDTLATSAQYQQ